LCHLHDQLRREVEVERKPLSYSINDLVQFVQNNIKVGYWALAVL
jgi:hypothetical protein